jgi:hypothetical protein
VSPTFAVPLITGATVFTGAGGGGSGTVLVATEEARADPAALVAVTVTSTVWPTSLEATMWRLEVAPLIAAQDPPELLQSCHW